MSSATTATYREFESQRTGVRFLRQWIAMIGLIVADCSAFASGYYLIRRGYPMPAFVLPTHIGTPDPSAAADIYLIMAVVFVFARYVFGDYGRRQAFWDGARSITSTLALLAVPDALFVLLVGNSSLYAPFIFSWMFLILGVPLFRQFARWLMSKVGVWQIRTVLIGSGQRASYAFESLQQSMSLGFDVQFLLTNEVDGELSAALEKLHQIPSRSAATLLRELGCAQAIVAEQDMRDIETTELIQQMIGNDIDVAIIPSLRGLPLFGLRTNYLFGRDMLILQLRNNLARTPGRLIKRLMDIVVPLLIIILTAPLWLCVALAIKLYDGGPVFFTQRRVGRGGKEFDCFKFRSMCIDAEETLAKWQNERPDLYNRYVSSNFKLKGDPRVTPVGYWLRKTSLDEIPQVFNVLIGQMSLVGPRPLLAREVPKYGSIFALYQRIRPGITGLWQISGRSETSFMDRANYDEWYILNWSLWYDIVILLQTVWIVCAGRGAF